MRINEAYEHEPMLTGTDSGCCGCGCEKMVTQCTDVSARATLTPSVTLGTVVATCQGSPDVVCVTDSSGTFCTLTMTQRVCLSIPVRYSVNLAENDPTIACGGDGTAAEGSCCG